jgi:hypothetical protein
MTGLLALISFICATVVFFIEAVDIGHVENVWGFFFIALGLALLALGGGIAYVEAKRGA